MRPPVDRPRLQQFLDELDRAATGPGRVYLCGGATALLLGWRLSTVDVDLQFDPEPRGVFEAIAHLKNRLNLNVEIAGPADFVPPLPGWRDRCVLISTKRNIAFFHYDPYTQALSKLARGHDKDMRDVAAMVQASLVEPATLLTLFMKAKGALIRYPRLEPAHLEARVREWVDAAATSP